MPKRSWQVWGTVLRWIDGDTMVADLDLGWETWRHGARVRLLGIDAPESRQPGGSEATVRARVLCPVGSVVRVESWRLDSFGRVLGSITLADGRDLVSALNDTTKEAP